MSKKKPLHIVFFIITIVFIICALISYIIYINQMKEPTDIIPDFFISISSLVISFIALIIALITYFSIDSVNNVTSMEGNVLENPNYTIAYSEMIKSFSNCKVKSEFEKKLLEKVCPAFNNKTLTCIQFADFIQNVIDHIIWFAYVDFKGAQLRNECTKLIQYLERELQRYSSLSNGLQYILNENIKLIKYVLDYQEERSLNRDTVCRLEDIRGKMLQNPISQIVYYNYLGLYYRNKANTLLRQCNSQNNEFSFEYMKSILQYNYNPKVVKEINILLNRARFNFDLADELAKTDILWQGYTQYNLARTFVMEYLINTTVEDLTYNYARSALSVRDVVCFLYRSANDSYLNEMFYKEYTYADNLLKEFKKLTTFVNDKVSS